MRLLTVCTLCILLAGALQAEEAALAVVEKVAGSVGFYTAGGARIAGVVVSKHPHEIVSSPDGRLLYVSDNGVLWMTDPGEGDNTISILDVRSRKKVGVIDLGQYRRPHGMAVDPRSGLLAVTIENPYGLLLVDPVQRKVLRKYDVQGVMPHMVVFASGGEWAYASNSGSATVAAVHLKTGRVKLIPTGERPQGAVLSGDGKRIYMTNSTANSISIIDTDKQEGVGVIRTGKGPGRIALTPDGATLVYNLQPGEAVGFADVATAKEIAQVPLGGRPLSLTMSRDGRTAYAGVQDHDKIFVLSVPERKIVRVIATPKGAGPDPALPLR